MLARAEFFRVGCRGVLGEGRCGDLDSGKLLEDPDEVFPWVDLPAAAAFDVFFLAPARAGEATAVSAGAGVASAAAAAVALDVFFLAPASAGEATAVSAAAMAVPAAVVASAPVAAAAVAAADCLAFLPALFIARVWSFPMDDRKNGRLVEND